MFRLLAHGSLRMNECYKITQISESQKVVFSYKRHLNYEWSGFSAIFYFTVNRCLS